MFENQVPIHWEERFLRAASNFSASDTNGWQEEAISRADSGDVEFFTDLLVFAAIMAPSVFRNIEVLSRDVLSKAPYREEFAKIALMLVEDLSRGRVASRKVDSRRLAVIQAAAIGVLIQDLVTHGAVSSVRARRGNSDVFLAREGQGIYVHYLVDTEDVPGAWTINQHFLPYGRDAHEHFSFGTSGTLLSGSEVNSIDLAQDHGDSISWKFNYMLFGRENHGLVDLTIALDDKSHIGLFVEMIRSFSKTLRIKLQVKNLATESNCLE